VSLAGRAATKGSTLRIYRPTYGAAPAADGSRKVSSWTLVAQDVRGVLDVLTADLADKVFGQASVARTRTMLPAETDVVAGDGLVVTAGFQVGSRFRVVEAQRYDFRARSAHVDVALESTTEAIA
jgi:hypothetical protein